MSTQDPNPLSDAAILQLDWQEWQRVEESALELRLMLAGVGFRFAHDARGKVINGGLASDIGVLQAHVQRLIDRAHENEAALGRLVRGETADEQPHAAASVPAMRGPLVQVKCAVFDQLHVAVEKWRETHQALVRLVTSMSEVANAAGDTQLGLALADAIEAIVVQKKLVEAAERQVVFASNSCDPADQPSPGGLH